MPSISLRGLLPAAAIAAALSCVLFSGATASAQNGPDDRIAQLFQSIPWEQGPTTAAIGTKGRIKLPAGYMITGRQGSQTWNQLTHNPPDGTEATLMPSDLQDGWFLVFQFSDIGYVKDDEKADLKADSLLKAMKEGTEASNDYRKQQGWSPIHVDRWLYPPGYDQTTHNLYWALLLRSDAGGASANYSTRLLGRRGVMEVTLVCSEEKMAEAVPKVKELLGGFEFVEGEKYAEWKNGDKIAQYGLTGLITGGAAVVAAKSGLLAKLATLFAKAGKAIFVGIAAIGGAIWRFFTGRESTASK